jgi:hypothetical protein
VIFRRILWHVNRSPAKWLIKFALRQLHRGEVRERTALAQQLPASPTSTAAADSLGRDGYAYTDLLLTPASRQGLAEAVLNAKGSSGDGRKAFGSHKDFWSHILESQMVDGSLPVSSPFVQFALQPELINTLAQIYGEVPRLDYVTVTHSKPSGRELKYSQLWHRDYDDVKVIKLFVYLTDVDDGDGPFTFVPGPASDKAGFVLRSHRPDEEMRRVLDVEKAMSIKGPRFTSFMVETSRCFHMGSRVADGHDRLMYTATFISAPRIYPERPQPFFKLDGSETPLERALLTS